MQRFSFLSRTPGGLATALGLLLLISPAFAHHSFAMFDFKKQTSIKGTVAVFQWTNPHIYIELDVPKPTGGAIHYTIECGSPSQLLRQGLNFHSLKAGDKVTLLIAPLKNEKPGGALMALTFPDGHTWKSGAGPEPAP